MSTDPRKPDMGGFWVNDKSYVPLERAQHAEQIYKAIGEQIEIEEQSFDRNDPDPYLFHRLRAVAAAVCSPPCRGGYLTCPKCGRKLS